MALSIYGAACMDIQSRYGQFLNRLRFATLNDAVIFPVAGLSSSSPSHWPPKLPSLDSEAVRSSAHDFLFTLHAPWHPSCLSFCFCFSCAYRIIYDRTAVLVLPERTTLSHA